MENPMLEEMKIVLLNIVNSSQGIKSVDLSLRVMGEINPHRFNTEEFVTALEELVITKEVVEVSYILPQMNYRIKSIYFPKGTKIAKEIINDA